VQFAGFTCGKSASAYNSPWHGYPGNNTSFLVGGYDTVTGINNIQYSWQFGNGVSATLGVDENSAGQFNRTQIINAIGGVAGGSIGFTGACTAFITGDGCAYGGTSAPDIVGNIRVDQAWGLFQISAAGHQVHAGYNATANIVGTPLGGVSQAGAINFGHPSDKWGGAVQASLQIKNIPTGAGDDIKLDGSWSVGASKYVLGTSAADPSSFAIYNGTKLAMGVVTDAIYSGGPTAINPAAVNPLIGLQLTRGWGFRGAFNHNWDPYWSTSLFGGIAGISYNSTAKTAWCNAFLLGGTSGITSFAGLTNCDPGFTIGMVGLVTRWTPVKNLTFSAETLWVNLHTKMAGSVVGTPSSALVLPTTTYTYGDNSNYSLNLRVQRNF
jgi:Porin subfamily